jgi:two-component system, NarL family, nitrate/nitrite response regulator NarL
MPVRILVADDHEVVLQGIRMILQSRPDWEICGEASNGTVAVQMAQELQPDAIIMDITMPLTNGLAATREISSLGIKAPVLMFTMHNSKGLVESVQAAGARGVVYKSLAARDLIEAIEILLGGGTYFRSESKETSPQQKKTNHGLLRCVLGEPVPSPC